MLYFSYCAPLRVVRYTATVEKIRELAAPTTGDDVADDWTDPAEALAGPAIALRNRASGMRFCLVAVDSDGVQLADAGITYSYQLYREWMSGGELRRAWSDVVTGAKLGVLYDDDPVNRGQESTTNNIYIKITAISDDTGVTNFELHAEEL